MEEIPHHPVPNIRDRDSVGMTGSRVGWRRKAVAERQLFFSMYPPDGLSFR